MKIIENLPKWVLTNPSPAFYETEGGTVLEQTAIMYKKIQEIVDDYNTRDEDIKTTVNDFMTETTEQQEAFEIAINQIIHDFTTLVELQLKEQDTQINNAVDYMQNNLDDSINEILPTVIEGKSLDIDFEYNTETESLDIKGIIVNDGGSE